MKVAIIGLGHIGGSLALDLKSKNLASSVIGVETNQDHADYALQKGLVDQVLSISEAIESSEGVFIATPVNVMTQLLPEVLDLIDDQWVVDLGSTKESLLLIVKNHPKRKNYLAAHPMAGQENSGPSAAVYDLFAGKCVVFCDVEDSAAQVVTKVEEIFGSLGMRSVYLDARSHDIHAAYVSHISHISSFALALTVLEKEQDEKKIFELASGGFESTVRLAKSSPDMWVPIFKQNRDNVLDVLDEHINTLATFRSLLIKKDFDRFYELIEQANHIRRILK